MKLEMLLVNQEFMNLLWGVNNQKHYLNEVIEVNTVDDPYNLLKKIYILKKNWKKGEENGLQG